MILKRYYSPDEPPAAPPADPPAEPAAPAWVDVETGKFNEGWKERIPEDVRGNKIFDSVDGIESMSKKLDHYVKSFGKEKVVLPGEASSEADWNAFYDAIGRPQTYDGYTFNRDEKVPEDMWDTGLIDKFKEGAHKLGFTQKQIDFIAGIENERALGAMTSMQEQQDAEHAAAKKALEDAWGQAYPERVRLANRVIHDTTEEGESRDKLLDKIGNDPTVLQWVSELGMKLVETKSIDTAINMKTPVENMAKVEELRGTPGFMTGEMKRTDPNRYQKIQNEITAIFKEMHPDK